MPRPNPKRMRAMVALWLLALIVGSGLVMYGLGPLFQARDQRKLMSAYTKDIERAANEASGLPGQSEATKAPADGAPVAILEIGKLRVQQVVVEGVGSSQTRKGPGHVPGTAGLGQPGNTVVVGRAHGFGGPFGDIGRVRKGNRILVTTTQGQSVYEVTSVRQVALRVDPGEEEASDQSVDDVYGPTTGDQLTLVTSRSVMPWNRSRSQIVVASLLGVPFAPTPQNGRNDSQSGLDGDEGATPAVVLAMLAYAGTMGSSILLYQRFRPTTAYILTIGPVAAATISAGETLSRVFPAWM